MASEVEEFAQRLSDLLFAKYRPSSCNEYVHVDGLRACIAEALRPVGPVDEQYPRMLYLHGSRSQTRMVNDAAEEAQAAAEGYIRTPGPQYEPGFPKWRVERPVSRGGWKRWDHRRVTLLTPLEEQQFLAVTEESDWIPDDVSNPHGARGVGLADLIAERKQALKDMVDREQLEIAAETDDDTAQDETASVEDTVDEVR